MRQLYDQLTSAIKKTSTAQDELNSKMDKQKSGANQQYIDDLTRHYDKLFGTIANRAGAAFGEVITRGGSLTQALGQQLLQLEAQFVQYLFSEVAKYAAAKAAEVVIHHTAETAKTASTATGASTRTSIELTASLKWIAMKLGEVTVQIATETAKTAAAIAGAFSRLASALAADIKSIGSAAATAAAHAFKWVMVSVPFPINLALAPAAAAAAFAGVMAFKSIAGAASGGLIQGEGTGTSDSILARLSHGEYVIQASAVNRLGKGFLDTINNRFAGGGAVDSGLGSSVTFGSSGSSALDKCINGNRIRVEIAHIDVKLGWGNFLTGGLGSLFGGLPKLLGLAGGGKISGAGTGTSDSIPAMLSNGEFVISAEATSKLGLPFLSKLNSGISVFAKGGFVGAASSKFSTAGSNSVEAKNNYIQPEINYHQHGSKPDMNQLHETVVNAVNVAIRRGQIKGFN